MGAEAKPEGQGANHGEPSPASPNKSLPEPPKDAYESVSRRFTWRSSLFMALGLWLVLMFTVSECAVAKSRRDSQDAPPPDQSRKEPTPPTTEKK